MFSLFSIVHVISLKDELLNQKSVNLGIFNDVCPPDMKPSSRHKTKVSSEN